ncbi:MAG: AsnC family transcriptional regulator [Rhodobacteraceae bacterium]|nr:AsnC family transcriptional regulator [Paracoccaceae bacterium]
MLQITNPIDRRLLDDWQRDFPITDRPFSELAAAVGEPETDVINRLSRMRAAGRITRVGATITPGTISASTLAAVAAPPDLIEEIAAQINAEPGVNHNYLREDHWNLWFVATGPDKEHVHDSLERISERTGLKVLNLPLVRPFNVDLGFRMTGGGTAPRPPRTPDCTVMQPGDAALLQQLTRGLPISEQPYHDLARKLDLDADALMQRVRILLDAGIISRLGVIVRHRALGWSANAMVVWDMPAEQVAVAGPALAAHPGVTLCYERRPVPGEWPYRLYCMIHARARSEAREVLEGAKALPELQGADHKVLFSTRCFKQTGALISRKEAAA